MTAPLKVALVGAGGQVGPYLLEYLSEDPQLSLLGICRNAVTAGPLRLAGFKIECGEIADPAVAADLLGDCDVVANLAAGSGTSLAEARAQDQAVLRSLVRLSGRKKIIHFSSVGVYGTCLVEGRNTFQRPRPDWSYGKDKLRLEHYLRGLMRYSRHSVVTLRLGHVYGVSQWVSRWVLTTTSRSRIDCVSSSPASGP